MRNIMRYVTWKHGDDWKEIGLELNFNHRVLTDIEDDNPFDNRVRFYDMIKKWISIDRNSTWSALELALTNVNRQKLGLCHVGEVYGMLTHRMNLMKTTKLVTDNTKCSHKFVNNKHC